MVRKVMSLEASKPLTQHRLSWPPVCYLAHAGTMVPVLAGALEALFAVKSLVHSLAPPVLNLWKQHPPVLGNLVSGRAAALPVGPKAVMSNSFGFGGTSTCLVLASPPKLDDWDV